MNIVVHFHQFNSCACRIITNNLTDFYCFNNVIVELKAVSKLENAHKAQVINYLKALNKEIGLLINFEKASLQWERISIFGLTK